MFAIKPVETVVPEHLTESLIFDEVRTFRVPHPLLQSKVAADPREKVGESHACLCHGT